MNKKRVLLAGGSGFIGQALARELVQQNYEVIVLTRLLREREDDGIKEVEWDGEHVGEWIQYLEGAEAVVNLTGRNINCRHTPENLREIVESRVNSVGAIAGGLYHVTRPPRLWVQAGAVGFYGNRHDEWCDEKSSNGQGRLAEICRRWEEAFYSAPAPKTRRILFRIGIVLGREGGALPLLAHYINWFLGGAAGTGRQYISWIHLADLVRMFRRGPRIRQLFRRHLQCRCPQSGHQCGIHARPAAHPPSSVVSTGACLGDKTGLQADGHRGVTCVGGSPLHAEAFSRKRF